MKTPPPDLTAVSQRMATCHPDRTHLAKGFCRECYFKQWTKAHRTEYLATKKRCNQRATGREVVTRLKDWKAYGNQERQQKIILKEVSHHLARGRSAERIAIWMNKPMSVINQAIQQLRP